MIDVNTYNQLKMWCKHLINLPDMDSSGKKYAYKYSQAFWQLDTVFLPEDMLGGGKDFRDYLSFLRKQGKSKESITYLFKNLLKVPVSCRFVIENDKKYRVDNENLYHFLNSHDYFVHISDFAVSKGNENKGVLVKLDGFKVSTPTSSDIRNFCVDFLRKNDPIRKKIEHIRTCNALRENELKQVPSIQLDFTKHGKDFQLFFFENICIKVTADGAKSATLDKNEYFVKADGIIKEQCHLLKERFFEEYKDENGQNRVKILKNDYHFMNFLINGSRVYWKEEHQKDKDSRSWGDAVREAFTPARRRLALTGTPFRSDESKIPFVRYEDEGAGVKRSRADYSYGYADALRDGVVRPVMFMTYSGQMRWRTKAGDEVAARLGEPLTKDLEAQAWRTALDPKGEWIPAVLAAADQRLTEVRRQVPDAGGLVIASDQSKARAYAKQLEAICGQSPTVVLSDDAGASSRIETFSASTDRWMVAVRMVSEGVDVPRLAVGVYATSTSTPLFFAQA